MQHLLIHQNESGDYQPLFCLKCGGLQEPESSSYCGHVTFVYLPQYDFEYVSPLFKSTAEKMIKKDETEEDQSIENLLINLPSNGSNLIVEISSLGMGCGPGSFRVLFGFDFSD